MISREAFIPGVVDKYPEELLDGRIMIEGNLLACLFKDPTYYDDIKTVVTHDKFITNDGAFLFGIIRFLREKGVNVIDEVTVMSNCPEEVKDKIFGMGGWKSIQRLMEVVDIKNWDVILDEFNKSNVLMKLHINGFNLMKEIKLENGKEKKPIDMFRGSKWDSRAVLEWYENFISGMTVSNTSSSTKVLEEKFVSFDASFFDSLKDGESSGYSIADAGDDINGNPVHLYSFLSRSILGLERRTTSAIAAHSGCGKTVLMMNIVYSLLTKGLKGVFVSNEMSMKDLRIILLMILVNRYVGYFGLTKKKLKTGEFNEEDKKAIDTAVKYWNENYEDKLKIVTMCDSDSDLTAQIIKKEALRIGADFFVVDTFKLEIGESFGDNAFWIDLIKDSRTLDSLAKKYDMIGLYTIQLAANSLKELFLDASALSMSKAIKEVLSNLIMMRKVYKEEFMPGSPYDCKPFRSVQGPDGVWSDVPFIPEDMELNPNIAYRCITIDKSRSGADSGDNGVGFLFKYQGDYCRFSETCKMRPVHKRLGQ